MGTEYTLYRKQNSVGTIKELSLYEMSCEFDLYVSSYESDGEPLNQYHIFNDLTPEEVIKLCCEGIKSASYFMDQPNVNECLTKYLETYGG